MVEEAWAPPRHLRGLQQAWTAPFPPGTLCTPRHCRQVLFYSGNVSSSGPLRVLLPLPRNQTLRPSRVPGPSPYSDIPLTPSSLAGGPCLQPCPFPAPDHWLRPKRHRAPRTPSNRNSCLRPEQAALVAE